jgi:two-component system response regulator AtoC
MLEIKSTVPLYFNDLIEGKRGKMAQELIFVVDDDPSFREMMKFHLEDEDFTVATFESGKDCLADLDQNPSVICLDMIMPGLDGIETLKRIKSINPHFPVIMVTSEDTVDQAVNAMKEGADDYILKPAEGLRLCTTIRLLIEKSSLVDQLSQMKVELKNTYSHKNIIGKSEALEKVFKEINKVKESNINVFINGESGTGKELVAKAIHHESVSGKGLFVDINCGAIPESLQESELFGHEKGAFTGAVESKKGKCELANGGTLFLDEIAEMNHQTQIKLLRFLQEKSFERIGGTKKIQVNLRIISATHKDLSKCVKEGTFREDLYYRLMVYPINLPSLRERQDDIPPLINHFLKKYRNEINKTVTGVSPSALEAMLNYDWPGNIRELENAIYRGMVSAEKEVIEIEDLPAEIGLADHDISDWQTAEDVVDETDKELLKKEPPPTVNESVKENDNLQTNASSLLTLDEAEKHALESSLQLSNNDFPTAAKKLGVSRATFYRKAKRHGLI